MAARYYKTEKVQYRLKLKERINGEPFFMLEPHTAEMSIVELPGWLGIELQPGTTYQQAEAVWKQLSELVWGLSYTRPVQAPDEEEPQGEQG